MTPADKITLPSPRRIDFRAALRIALIFIVYILAFTVLDSGSRTFEVLPGVVAWYPPDGLSFALLLTLGIGFAPALAVSSLISNVFVLKLPLPLSGFLIWALILTLAFGVAAWFLRRWVRLDTQLRTTRDLFWMIAVAAIVSAVLAVISVSASGAVPPDQRIWATFQWWTGEMIGILVLAPALLIHVMAHVKRFAQPGAPGERTAISFSQPSRRDILQIFSVLVAIFLAVEVSWPNDFHPYFLIGIPLVWIATEHGLAGATLANVFANFGITFAVQRHPHFELAQLGQLQLMMLVISTTSLLIGIIVSENKQSGLSPTHEIERRRKKVVYDLIVVAILAMAAWVLEYTFNFFEEIIQWETRYKIKGVDETVITIVVLGFASAVFSYRRWREFQVELREREKAQGELQTLYRELETRVLERTEDLSKTNELLQGEIAERKKSVEALEQGERRLRGLVEHSMEETSLITREGTLIFESPTLRRPLGYPAGSFVGHPLLELFHPEDLPIALKLLEQVSAEPGSYRDASFRLRHRDGSWRWMEGTMTNLLDEPAVGAIVINYRDITERKQVEQALRDSEEYYRLLFDSNPLPMWVYDRETLTFLAVNDAAVLHYGYLRDEFLAMTIKEIRPQEDVPALLDNVLAAQRIQKSGPWKHRKKDGTLIDVEIHSHELSFGGRQARLVLSNDITERKQAEQDVQSRTDELSTLYEFSRALPNANDLDEVLDLVIRRTVESLHVTFARIALLEGDEFVMRSAYPIRVVDRDLLVDSRESITAMPYCQRILEQDEAVILRTSDSEVSSAERRALLLDFTQTVALIPLRVHEFAANSSRILGLLMAGETRREEREPFTVEKMRLARSIGDQAAIAIDKARLFNDLQRSNIDLSMAYDATIAGWSAALDLRDKETEGHTLRVTEMTLTLAKGMGFSAQELIHVRRGALLHDIGKMGVPDSILLKPDKLTDGEWEVMRMHPIYAYQMLAPVAYLGQALDIPYCHHEKWDGTGYPRKLKGTEIPLSARVFAVVDVYDALTSDRPYRPRWTKAKTIAHIRANSGSHFDPQVVDAFVNMIEAEK